ncbi:hypothetical protein HDC92_001310 [Pedobacter sp. AK017]|uniref:hypothetical protein n=1 Tax=Pedobacter sp. AK017 TaxID=2723073 RepID=UPI00161D56B9|nr:hypothetical protein [Pedobacter sp. AK017]MBB5437638.1 hypothetical protein [Pedobacter sp. AK017]
MKTLSLILFACIQGLIVYAQADTWVATDALGRKIIPESNGLKKDKYVGVFYFIWHGAHGYDRNIGSNAIQSVRAKELSDTASPYNISEMLIRNPSNPKYGPVGAFHYWGEPYFGYYLSDDEWVIRKHGQMLADAGVDVLILDVTNAAIYLPQVIKIVETFRKMQDEGSIVPKIAFIVNSNPERTVSNLYERIYKKELFKDFWFYWKGKPLLLCPPEALTPEMRAFFSSRQSWAWSKDQDWFEDGKDKWTWLDHTPQSYGWHESKDKPEQISVAVAEHPTTNIGRSFHNGKEPEQKHPERGLYFEEQWKRALQVDPEFVFITGWNEWVAMRFNNGASEEFLGKPIQKGENFFVDLYNDEYSRDAEPVMGAFNDNYYYQMVANIRKFKGSRPVTSNHKTDKIKVDGNFSDWRNVETVFRDDRGDTFHRKHPGWGRIKEYTNVTGRNDIIESRITCDSENVYFYVKTKDALTSWTDKNWMQLFVAIEGNENPHWNGFNFLVNAKPTSKLATDLQLFDGSKWFLQGNIKMNSEGNELELLVPKKMLGIKGQQFTLDFKWSDNSPAQENVMNWLDKGDSAPNGRFAYRFIKK